jgi:quercetin dioxygenase-like cupin family protein
VFIKQMYLKDTGTIIPQHAHLYDHTSMLARGRIRAWADGVELGDFEAPHPLYIPARVKHTFMSLENDTLIYCIHRSTPVIFAEHQILGSDFSGE